MKRVLVIGGVLLALGLVAAAVAVLAPRLGGDWLSRANSQPASTRPAASRPATAAASADWPIYRGEPGMLGVAAGTLPAEMKLRWKFKTGSDVTSSPIIVGGRVFVGSMDANVYCLDLAKGAKVWSVRAGDAVESSPTWVDGTVYVGADNAELLALDAKTGREKWKFSTGDRVMGAANTFRDPKTGKTRIVFGSYDFTVYCLDPATGEPVWKYTTGYYINGGVAVAGGQTVCGGCDARIHVVPADGNDGNVVDAGAYVAATPAFDGRFVYVGNYEGGFLCIDVRARKAAWSYTAPGPFFSSPAVAGARVLAGCRDNSLYCFDRKTGTKLWSFPTQGEVNSSPVVCGDKVVFGSDDGRLYVVALADGKKVWSYDLGDAVTSSPAVAAGCVVVGCNNGYVYAFEAK
jgi:eukaryotic-like serine/threonine-protein kinase